MSSGLSTKAAHFPTQNPQPRWTFDVGGAIHGLSLARESGHVLARSSRSMLHLLNRRGELQARYEAPRDLSASRISDDGSAIAVGAKKGDVWWLRPDLSALWHRSFRQRISTLALDPLGQFVAVSDASGTITTLTREGQVAWTATLPRALAHLQFVPERPLLVGSADLGLIVCLDFNGGQRWQDRRVTHVGGLAVSGDGHKLMLACFGDGLCQYRLTGPPAQSHTVSEPCRRVSLSYDGQVTLAAGLQSRLFFLDADAKVQWTAELDAAVSEVHLGPLAEDAVVGFGDGRVQHLRWR